MEMNTTKNRSYQVRRELPVGSEGVTTHDLYFRGDVPAGTIVDVIDYSDAGFRGIVATVRVPSQGNRLVVMDAGLLDAN